MVGQSLRTPVFLVAIVLLGMVLLAELGMAVAAPVIGRSTGAVGWAIPCLALIDTQLVFTACLMAAPLIFPERVTGRMQGIATFIVALLLVIACFITAIAAFTLLSLLIGLLLAVPFGPVAYAGIRDRPERPRPRWG